MRMSRLHYCSAISFTYERCIAASAIGSISQVVQSVINPSIRITNPARAARARTPGTSTCPPLHPLVHATTFLSNSQYALLPCSTSSFPTSPCLTFCVQYALNILLTPACDESHRPPTIPHFRQPRSTALRCHSKYTLADHLEVTQLHLQ